MPQPKRHLALAVALLALFLLSAFPAGALPLDRTLPDLFARGWSFLSALWEEEGCSLDPHGGRGPSSAPVPILSDVGCSLDPYGRCGSSSAPAPILRDAGCVVDPEGRCGQ
ncbi:MAG: hypothetical protein ABJC13_14680 [Acidobacteriota bacterium]